MAEYTQKWERSIISNLQWSTILSTQVSMPPVWLRPFFFKYALHSANFKPSRLFPPTGKSYLSVHVGKNSIEQMIQLCSFLKPIEVNRN